MSEKSRKEMIDALDKQVIVLRDILVKMSKMEDDDLKEMSTEQLVVIIRLMGNLTIANTAYLIAQLQQAEEMKELQDEIESGGLGNMLADILQKR